MCELFGLSSSDPVRLTFGWASFSARRSHREANPDGWGVAFMNGVDATLFREATPVVESPVVNFLASHAPSSELVISHVRRATQGANRLANTQPFQRVLGGRTHVFAHNGFVALNDLIVSSPWLVTQGDTDSEKLFCLLLSRLEPLWQGSDVPSLKARLQVLRDFANEFMERGAINFLYSDSVSLFAHGHRRTVPGNAISDEPGLYVLTQESRAGTDGELLCDGIHINGNCAQQALIATVPLNERSWSALSAGKIACFEKGIRVC